jgi:hypothetical protein
MKKLDLQELWKFIMQHTGKVSDGYHTFDELYEFRKMYNALLFNEWYKQGKYQVHKSWRHNDGKKCFDNDNWFIVSAMLPTGQISNHYKKEDWDLFQVEETPKALFEFDGNTSKDVLERMIKLISYENNKNKS